MNDVTKWWSTEIIDMKPGSINLRGKPIQDLIGKKSFVEMIWFMTTGEEIDSNKLFLLEAALVSSVDHGPQAHQYQRQECQLPVGLISTIH